jgi:selenocysteine-specific elongation factor
MRVIGTAGHVDHGKSSLVLALTGTNPDRLKEEREREMTIELGFAWMTLPPSEALPSGEEVGIVDVPGHRDFIENMLSGVGGIDAALFVIAADEGVMPQTREHLAILDILQIDAGVIALTKTDLVPDTEWLDLVEEDVRRSLQDTVLEHAPIVRVSSKTRQGLPELLQAISACLADRPPRMDLGRPRLPVDRIFTIAGFGTVVTGTLMDGHFRVGDDVVVLSENSLNARGRVRGLQTHKRKEDVAVPGSRTAVNIAGIDLDQVQRGAVVAHPGDYQQTRRVDVRFRLLRDARLPLTHGTQVKFFIGAAEVLSRVRLLGLEELIPGQEAWLQLELEKSIVAVRGDHYILRRPSPGETLGGGIIVDPHPKGRYRRFAQSTLARLEALTQGTPGDILLQALLTLGAAPLHEVIVKSSLSEDRAADALQELLAANQLVSLEGNVDQVPGRQTWVTSRAYWEQLIQRTLTEVENYHKVHPLRRGLPKEDLKSRLKLPPRLFTSLLKELAAQDLLVEQGPVVFHVGHEIRFSPSQQLLVDSLLKKFTAAPYAPPTIKDCIAEVRDDVYTALVDLGELVPIPPDVVFRRPDYDTMVAGIRGMLEKQGTLSAAQVRDHFNTSRRYALAVLEHLDALGVTIRDGDIRRLK